MKYAALAFAEWSPFEVVQPMVWAVPNDAMAVVFVSLFHVVAQLMCNWPMLVAYAFCWHELQPVFVT